MRILGDTQARQSTVDVQAVQGVWQARQLPDWRKELLLHEVHEVAWPEQVTHGEEQLGQVYPLL